MTSQRSMRRSASSNSLGSMAGKDGVRSDDDLSEHSEQSSVISGNIKGNVARNKVMFRIITLVEPNSSNFV